MSDEEYYTDDDIEEYSNQLKPCPFCGSKATIEYGSGDYNVFRVACSNRYCNCELGWDQPFEELVKMWNTRVKDMEE